MVDNPKNNPADDETFDFGADWASSDGADEFSADSNSFDQGFGSSDGNAFGVDESDPFSADGDDVFASADPFGDAFEEDDGFHSIPTPDALSAKMEDDVDPEDDFGDVGTTFDMEADGGDVGQYDGFEDTGSDANSFASDDGFGENENLFEAEQTEDVFSEGDQEYNSDAFDEEEEFLVEDDVAAASNAGSKSKGNLILAGGLIVLLGVGYVGYSSIAPMFFGGAEQYAPPTASVPMNPGSQFPSGLPGQDGGLPLSSAEVNPSVGLPNVSVSSNDPLVPVTPVNNQQTSMVEEGAVFSPPLDLDDQEAPSLVLPGMDGGVAPTVGLPVSEPSFEDELIAGDRGGIASMREQDVVVGETSSGSGVGSAEVQAILDRIDDLENKFESRLSSMRAEMDARLSDFEKNVALAPVNRTDVLVVEGERVEETGSFGKPPLKPSIIEDMTLKGVSRGMAWVQTPTGIIEARVGDDIAGAGRVLGIREYNGTWLASTEKGLILQ